MQITRRRRAPVMLRIKAAQTALVLAVIAVTSGCHGSPSASPGTSSSARSARATAPSLQSGPALGQTCPRDVSAVQRARSVGPFRVADLLPGSKVAQSGPFARSLGSPEAIALLTRISRIYQRVPGVEMSSTQPTSARLSLWLCSGTITGEEFITAGTAPSTLVAEGSATTFVRDTAEGCWRRLAPSDPQNLTNIGEPFPFDYDPKVGSGHRSAVGLQITVETPSVFWRWASRVHAGKVPVKSFLTYTFDSSFRVHSVHIRASDLTVNATLDVAPLAAAPAIPRPVPICPAGRP
jgi:hypothetical protein